MAEVGPGAGGTEAIRRMWPDVMGRLGGLKRTTWSLVSHYAQVLDYDGKRLLLQFDSPGRAASFGKGAHQEFLRQALIDVMGIDCRFEATAGDAPAPAAPPPAQPAAAGVGARLGADQARTRRRPTGRRAGPAEPRDDVPLPPEPPPDDLPPEPERPGAGASVTRPAAAPAPAWCAWRTTSRAPTTPTSRARTSSARPVVEQMLGGRVIEDRTD